MVADITTLRADVIVNAANSGLMGGGGVDGAIHRAAGPELMDECERLPLVRAGVRCPMGEVRVTKGHRLPSKWVVHAVGPIWSVADAQECDRLLASCYAGAIKAAVSLGAKSIAFPCVSTGAYGYPKARAAGIAVEATHDATVATPGVARVVFACFSDEDVEPFRALGVELVVTANA
jgi:O-acetyl-ADP-ribose deacetylase (regulator of RNase III)